MNCHYLRIVMDEYGAECAREDATPEIRRLQAQVAELKELLTFVRQIALELDRKLMEGRQ